MKFNLKAELILNKKLDKGIEGEIAASKSLLEKGAPEGEEGKIENYELKEDKLLLELSSGQYVRPHDAVFRIKNFLSKEWGPKYHIGVREIKGIRYKIEFEVDSLPKREIKVPFVNQIDFNSKKKTCQLLFKDLEQEFLQKNYVDRIINLIHEKIRQQQYKGKKEYHQIIWESPKKEHHWNKDPSEEMEEREWIKHQGRGQWIFGPQATFLMREMEKIVEKEILKPLDIKEVIVPKAVNWDVWKKSGHAQGLYPEIYYICPPKTRSQEFWEEVTDLYKITREIPKDLIKDKIDVPIGGVCYAQCPPFWPYLEGKTIADDSLPLKVFDRSGTSMRYESGGIHGIERVDEFHRIEIVWIGTQRQVKDFLKGIKERYKKIFNQILDLEWRMARVTPWFRAQEGKEGLSNSKEEKDSNMDLEGIGTIDFEAYLPYRGSREDSEWLEFQNASNNGLKYPKGFNVKSQKQKELYSGCTGIGLERWLVTFLAQKGMNPENWPKKFKKEIDLKNFPERIEFL